MRRAEGLKREERSKYTRFECVLEKGVGQTGCPGQEKVSVKWLPVRMWSGAGCIYTDEE